MHWNLGVLGVVGKLSAQLRFNKIYFIIFRAKVWKNYFWVDFVVGSSNKLQKLGSEGKSIEHSMCSHLGPTTKATLVRVKKKYE